MSEEVKETTEGTTKSDQPQETTKEIVEAKAPEVLYEKKEEAKQEQTTDEEVKAEEKKEAELDLKLPEKSILIPAHVEKVKEVAKKFNLTQEQAQGILEQESLLAHDIINNPEVRQFHIETAKAEWRKQAESDKEIGGEKLNEAVELAKYALNHDSLKSATMNQMIEDFGFGNHPEFIRFASRVGRLLKNDSIIKGAATPAPKAQTPWERMYGAKQN